MGKTVDYSKMSDDELLKLANGEASSPEPEKPEKKILKGGVSVEEGADKVLKAVVPQPTDNPVQGAIKAVELPTAMAALGFGSVPEDVGNFALGAAQNAMNVPPEKQVTAGDLARQITGNPSLATANEILRSQAYQKIGAGNPVADVGKALLPLAGGFTFPLGGANAAKLQRPIARALAPMAAGAAFAPVFGGGSQFGATGQMPNLSQLAQMAGGGAIVGGGMHAGLTALNAMLARRFGAGAQAIQNGTQNANTVQDIMARFGLGGPGAQSPESMLDNYRTAFAKIRASNMTPERIQSASKKLLQAATKHEAFQAEGGPEALAKFRNEVAQAQLKDLQGAEKTATKSAEKADARSFSSKQQQARIDSSRELTQMRQQNTERNMQLRAEQKAAEKLEGRTYTEQKQQTKAQEKISSALEHAGGSGEQYRTLHDLVAEAKDPEELRYLEQEINDAGTTKDGKPILQPWQRNNLMSAVSRKRREVGLKPGETNGGGEGSKPTPIKGEPESQTGAKTDPAGGAHRGAGGVQQEPQPKPESAEGFLTGLSRKTLSPELMKRENRYKVAVSVDALGQVAGLSQAEITALKQSVQALSENAVERHVRQQQLNELVDWALKNTDDWDPKVGDLSKTYHDDGIVLAKTGETQRMLLRCRMERALESKFQMQLSYVRSQLIEEGQKRGDLGPEALRLAPNPTMSVTVNGKAKDWTAKENGGLKISDMEKISPHEFKPPQDLNELYERAKRLNTWIDHFKLEDTRIRNAEGEFDYLGNGSRPIDILQKAFENREDIWKDSGDPSKVPTAHVWHVDDFGHVVTVRFERQKQFSNFNEATQDLKARYDAEVAKMHDEKGYLKEVYSTKWLQGQVNAFTGLEAVPFIAGFASKHLHKFATAATRNSNLAALTVGTTDNIIRGKVEWGGDKISAGLHNMIGTILDSFARDKGVMLAPIQGAEDLTELLNKFKGTKLNLQAYSKQAIEEAVKAGRTSDEDITKALKQARTALFIRKKYTELAKALKPLVEELDARKQDISSLEGQIPAERMKKYQGSDFIEGRLKEDVYDSAFHGGLRSLVDSLELKPQGGHDSMSELIGRMASRKNASIFGNNFSVGFGNFFDAGISTLLEFNKHFFKAVGELSFNPAVREAIHSLPILPQADMEYVALQESLARRPRTNNLIKKAYYKYEDLQSWLATEADFLFRGKERIVSLADRLYSRAGALASIYKQAESYGMEGNELLHELLGGENMLPQERAVVWQRVSEDLSRLYNSVSPHLNRDMLASSGLGKTVAAYSGPQRRTFRIYWDWARSDRFEDRLKFHLAMVAQIALAGRGVIPKSLQLGMTVAGAATGYNVLVEKTFQNLDDANVFRKTTGIDLKDRMGFDILNVAGPPLEALKDYGGKAQSIATKSNDPDTFAKEMGLTFGETLAIFPRVGPLGYDVWKKGLSNYDAAGKGYKVYYVQVGSELKPVTVPGYDINDAIRGFAVPGLPPKAFDEEQRLRMRAAEKKDATKARSRGTVPGGNESVSAPSILPSVPKDG